MPPWTPRALWWLVIFNTTPPLSAHTPPNALGHKYLFDSLEGCFSEPACPASLSLVHKKGGIMWFPAQEGTLRDGLAVLAMASAAPSSAHGASTCFLRSVISEPTHFWEEQDELWASLVAQPVKNLPAIQETWVRSLVQEDPLEKWMVICSSILTQRIPQIEQPDGLQSLHRKSDMTEWPKHTHTHAWTTRSQVLLLKNEFTDQGMEAKRNSKPFSPFRVICQQVLIKSGGQRTTKLSQETTVLQNQDSEVQIKQFKIWIRPSLLIYCCPSTTSHNCAGWTLNSLGSTISNITDREFCIDCNVLQVERGKVSWWKDAIF